MSILTSISLVFVGFIITAFFGVGTFFQYRQQVQTMKWPTVPGFITVSQKTLVFVENSDHIRIGMAWQPVVKYRYKVKGVDYLNDQISAAVYQDKTIPESKKGQNYADVPPTEKFVKFLDQYTVGKQVLVHYNPDKPEVSVLEIDSTGSLVWGVITFLGILLSIISLGYYYFVDRAR